MIGTVAVLLLVVVAAAVVTLAVRLRQTRRELRETRAEAARLARATDILAEATATDILAGALGEPPVPRQHRRRRHLRALPVWLGGLGAGAWVWARRSPHSPAG